MYSIFHRFTQMLPRSLSTPPDGIVHPSRFYNDHNPRRMVHLIPSDLWAEITGERVSPDLLCQMQEFCLYSGAAPAPPPTSQGVTYAMMARDRQECRNLQQKLQDGTPAEREVIFNALFPQIGELMFDCSANYVVQKLCEVATKEQQQRLLRFFLADAKRVIEHANGCRVLQKFIECTDTKNVDALFVALKEKLIDLCRSLNGNHIVQRFIEILHGRVDEIIEILKPHLVELGVDNCGCRVVQKLFDIMSIDKLEPLVGEVLKHAQRLATNQYGNYVVQSILKAERKEHVLALIKAFTGHFYEFSVHKFASNVIEKCIRGATPDQRERIFEEIIGEEGNYRSDRILTMIQDQFGNYVLQRIIEFGTKSQQNAINDVAYEHYDELCNINYAKYVITRLEYFGYKFYL